jgi:dTDP-4-dehydrorhamnose reductase
MAEQTKIAVTGSNGQLGSELRELSYLFPAYKFYFLTRNELPLSDNEVIQRSLADIQPAFLINCAAYTAVDKAESERGEAFQINASAVGAMAEYCQSAGCKFIHISTDYVFDGSQEALLKENAPVGPINVYGESKLAGEIAAMEKNADSVIIRTSWVYSSYGKNFVKTMIRLMTEKESISVVNDQSGSPTYAADLARAILSIIGAGVWHPGIYHFSNEGVITWFDFAREIASLIDTKCTVLPTTTENFPTPAKRPRYSAMDKQKIISTYNLSIRPWQESLKECIEKLKANSTVH